jgi:hypothetical protein
MQAAQREPGAMHILRRTGQERHVIAQLERFSFALLTSASLMQEAADPASRAGGTPRVGSARRAGRPPRRSDWKRVGRRSSLLRSSCTFANVSDEPFSLGTPTFSNGSSTNRPSGPRPGLKHRIRPRSCQTDVPARPSGHESSTATEGLDVLSETSSTTGFRNRPHGTPGLMTVSPSRAATSHSLWSEQTK